MDGVSGLVDRMGAEKLKSCENCARSGYCRVQYGNKCKNLKWWEKITMKEEIERLRYGVLKE